jgi:hypothetical protein
VLLLAEDVVRAGQIAIDGLTIETADVRGRARRPHGFGVEALQGALTVWNRQPDPAVTVSAEILNVSAGTRDEPVAGSGVFVGGHGDWAGKANGGTLRVSRLTTGEIVTDGRIPADTPDLISGGVFVISGAIVDEVENGGPVTTYGQNDMVLDNWGQVREWRALAPIVSEGPSGIGFVNFGDLDTLAVRAPVATHGRGARGFNLYDGSLQRATFTSIATSGDGSVGVQVSRPMGTLEITGDLSTTGGRGLSLVKGVQVELEAIALSVKPGGVVQDIRIGGTVSTQGLNVPAIENEGEIGRFAAGAVHAAGSAQAIRGSALPGVK